MTWLLLPHEVIFHAWNIKVHSIFSPLKFGPNQIKECMENSFQKKHFSANQILHPKEELLFHHQDSYFLPLVKKKKKNYFLLIGKKLHSLPFKRRELRRAFSQKEILYLTTHTHGVLLCNRYMVRRNDKYLIGKHLLTSNIHVAAHKWV